MNEKNPSADSHYLDLFVEKLKAEWATLLPPDVLRGIVERGISKAFFEPRQDPSGWHHTSHPPLIVEVIREVCKDAVQEEARKWAAEHADEVRKAVAKSIPNGIANAVIQAFSSLWTEPMNVLRQTIEDRLQSLEHPTQTENK